MYPCSPNLFCFLLIDPKFCAQLRRISRIHVHICGDFSVNFSICFCILRRFMVARLKKSYNDSLETFTAKLKELGIPEDETASLGFVLEELPAGCTSAPAGLVF